MEKDRMDKKDKSKGGPVVHSVSWEAMLPQLALMVVFVLVGLGVLIAVKRG